MSSIYDERHAELISSLKQIREEKNITQAELATRLGHPQSYVSKVENAERRLDIIELLDWLKALDHNPTVFLKSLGWIDDDHTSPSNNLPPLPIPHHVQPSGPNMVAVPMQWRDKILYVVLENVSTERYLDVEEKISDLYKSLNTTNPDLKNREAICNALEYAITAMPGLNPSDIYHHIVYRLYLREYSKTQADRSWVRAGGEAVELFFERHYAKKLPPDIKAQALITNEAKRSALDEMGLSEEVGGSKLDIALYGKIGAEWIIFGGVHIKASLAERVSDDVPCSEAMMRKGLLSLLFTFDAKSFPPPNGDLVNRGELGSLSNPSDKRKYIEDHGSFDACFSYNLRTVPSSRLTKSNRRIFVSTFENTRDQLPEFIIQAWHDFKSRRGN